MSPRAVLRVFAGALVAGALLLVLQTATYRLLSLDWPFRAAFAASDVAIFVALRLLSRRAPKARAALGFATLFAVLAILTDVPVPDAPLSVVGLPFALGLTLLSLLALHTMRAHSGRRALTVLILITGGLAFCFRLAKMVATGEAPLPLAFAWTSWSIEVLRPLLLAAFAWSVSRDLAPAAGISPTAPSPYRDAAAIPIAPEPLPESARPHALNADAALATYTIAFVARCAALFTPVLVFFIVVAASGVSGRTGVFLAAAVISLASLVTEAMLLTSTSRLRKAEANVAPKTRMLLVLASGALVLAIVADGFSLIAGMLGGDPETGFFVFVSYVFGAALSFFSLVAVTRAVAHVGERLADERVVGLARLFLAESVAGGALVLAAAFVVLSGGQEVALLVTSLLLLGAGGIVVAGFVCALKLLSATRAALRSALPPPLG